MFKTLATFTWLHYPENRFSHYAVHRLIELKNKRIFIDFILLFQIIFMLLNTETIAFIENNLSKHFLQE